MGPLLEAALGKPLRELDLVSPYFVPTRDGTAALVALARRGVKVRVLTNSLAATDVAPVHAGYAKYREALLAGGLEERAAVAAQPLERAAQLVRVAEGERVDVDDLGHEADRLEHSRESQRRRHLEVLRAVLNALAEEAEQQPAHRRDRHAEEQREEDDEQAAGKGRVRGRPAAGQEARALVFRRLDMVHHPVELRPGNDGAHCGRGVGGDAGLEPADLAANPVDHPVMDIGV